MVDLITETEAAKMLYHQPKTLQKWRFERRGPNYTKIGRKIFYDPKEIEKFIKEQKIILND